MGAMSIVALQRDEEGMDIVPESSDQTWLDLVKGAAHLEIRDIARSDFPHYPTVVEQSWIQNIIEAKDFRKARSTEYAGDLLQSIADGLDEGKKANRLLYEEECELVRDLLRKLEDKGGLTEECFLGMLRPYLVSLKRNTEGGNISIAADEPHSNGAVPTSERRSTLALVKKLAPRLGPRLVSVIIECCTILGSWSMINILLERKVIDNRNCSRIIESAIQKQEPRTLCHCITYVPDLAPLDVYSMLIFFLDSSERTPSSFQIVKGDWRRLVLQKILAYSKKKDAAPGVDEQSSPATLLALAKAIDGFSANELCLHHLVASEQDESVLSSVVAKLEPPQLLSLLQYLCKWVDQYSSPLGRYPLSKIGRIPSLNDVVFWSSVILEGNYTKFVLSADYHPVVKGMRDLVQPLVELCTHLTPLIGIVDQLRYRRYIAATKSRARVPKAPTDYVIELLDLGS